MPPLGLGPAELDAVEQMDRWTWYMTESLGDTPFTNSDSMGSHVQALFFSTHTRLIWY